MLAIVVFVVLVIFVIGPLAVIRWQSAQCKRYRSMNGTSSSSTTAIRSSSVIARGFPSPIGRSVLEHAAAASSDRSRDDGRDVALGIERDLDVFLRRAVRHEPHGLTRRVNLEWASFADERLRERVEQGNGHVGKEPFVRAAGFVDAGSPLGAAPFRVLHGAAKPAPDLRNFHQASLSANDVSTPSRSRPARSPCLSYPSNRHP